MKSLPTCASYHAWKRAEADAEDAEAVLRLAFIKHIEGLGEAPGEEMQESARKARYSAHRAMCAALKCRCQPSHQTARPPLKQASAQAPSA
ncbi:MAG TPA: hypothetical protein VL593_10860 [Ramlibacter sp.]|jgi:hypothetical protein|nr:hypothetical protein [Ramlibacter sp.]